MKKLLLLVMLFIITLSSFSQHQEIKTDKYKAMFITNFIRFIGWSEENTKGDFKIGILKNKYIYDVMVKLIANKKFGYQEIKIFYFDDISKIENCQILYISTKQILNKKTLSLIKQKVQETPTLIISDLRYSSKVDIMINFVVIDNRLKFEVDVDNITNSGLKISNGILGLSNVIKK